MRHFPLPCAPSPCGPRSDFVGSTHPEPSEAEAMWVVGSNSLSLPRGFCNEEWDIGLLHDAAAWLQGRAKHMSGRKTQVQPPASPVKEGIM